MSVNKALLHLFPCSDSSEYLSSCCPLCQNSCGSLTLNATNVAASLKQVLCMPRKMCLLAKFLLDASICFFFSFIIFCWQKNANNRFQGKDILINAIQCQTFGAQQTREVTCGTPNCFFMQRKGESPCAFSLYCDCWVYRRDKYSSFYQLIRLQSRRL